MADHRDSQCTESLDPLGEPEGKWVEQTKNKVTEGSRSQGHRLAGEMTVVFHAR